MVKKIRKWLEEYQDHLGYLVISIVSLVVTGIYAYYQSDVISLIIFLYFVGDAIYRVNAYFHYKADTLKKIESISYRVSMQGKRRLINYRWGFYFMMKLMKLFGLMRI